MTRKEALKLLADARFADDLQGNDDLQTAHIMAMKALAQEPCEDYISRSALLDRIDEERKSLLAIDMKGAEHIVVHHARRLIEDAQGVQPESRWIPVSERLPKAGEYIGDVAKYYLVQNEYGDMLVARYTHSGYWEQMYQMNPIADEIVAWMPLPTPHKAESEDE